MDKDYIENITGEKTIPVYEGAMNLDVSMGRRATTLVLYPITRSQRKVLKKELSSYNNNCFVNHLKWLQDPDSFPPYTRLPGGRIYDIEKEIIYCKKEDQNR